VTIQVDMHDQLALTLQDDLTARIVKDRSRGVLIDISSLDVVDSFIGRMISNIAAMSRVLDAQTSWSACARGRDHAGRARPRPRGRAHRAQRRAGHGPAARHRGRVKAGTS
jgi:hypothetical protein